MALCMLALCLCRLAVPMQDFLLEETEISTIL